MRDLSRSTGQIVVMTEEPRPITEEASSLELKTTPAELSTTDDNAAAVPEEPAGNANGAVSEEPAGNANGAVPEEPAGNANGAVLSSDGVTAVASVPEMSSGSGSEIAVPRLPLQFGVRMLPKLVSVKWWNAAITCAWEFRAYTLKPAALLAWGVLVFIAGNYYVAKLFSTPDKVWMANEFLGAAAIAGAVLIGSAVGSIVAITWSIAAWFMSLTAFTRSFLSIDPERASRAEIVEAQREAVSHFKVNKRLILSTWLVYSVLMTLPSTWLLIAGVVATFAAYPAKIGVGPPASSPLLIFCAISSSIAIVMLVNHGLFLFAYSGVSKKGGRVVAVEALKAAVLTLPLITIVSSVSLVVGVLLIGLTDLVVILRPGLFETPFLFYAWVVVAAVWHGVSSMIILPLALVLPCEMVRGSIE